VIEYLNIFYAALFIFQCIGFELVANYIVSLMMKIWIILYCPKCKCMKLKYGKEKGVFICKKCGTFMEWIEIPDDLLRTQVKYFRITFALYIPITLTIILFLFFDSIFFGFTIGFLIIFIVMGLFTYLIPRMKIKKWVTKL